MWPWQALVKALSQHCMPAILSIISVIAPISFSEWHWLVKQAPYFCWNSLDSIIDSIFFAVATSAQSLILASLTASLTAAGNSAMSASSTSCFMFPLSSIHPMALRTQSSVSISSMAEAFISSIEGHEASQLLNPEGFFAGFFGGFPEGFLEGIFGDFFEGFFGDFFVGFLGLFDEGFFPFFPFITLSFFIPLSEGSSKSKALPELRSLVSGDIDMACISSMVAAIISMGMHCFNAASIFL